MTTSSSDRCTRISPSAVLDDRLDGKDLEWARDHLRRCESCRERVEDFREMLLRVGRLPKATVGAAAMDEAYSYSVPQRFRDEAGIRTYEISAPDTSRMVPPISPLPSAIRPELTSVPDLMRELEREIFRDEPGHPTPLGAAPEPPYPTMTPPAEAEPPEIAESEPPAVAESEPPAVAEPEAVVPDDTAMEEQLGPKTQPFDEPVTRQEPPSWRQVPVDSQRHMPPPAALPPSISTPPESAHHDLGSDDTDWARLLERIANAPDPDAGVNNPEPATSPFVFAEPPPPAPAEPASSSVEPADVTPQPLPAMTEAQASHRNVVYDDEPALAFPPEEPVTAAPRGVGPSQTLMRVAVAVGAAACLLIAALLYQGGYLLKPHQNLSATSPTVAATHKPSARPSSSAKASASPTPAPTVATPTGTVLYTLGNGVSGNTVFRIRPGTAVAGYTRLVFDMHGSGLPTMVITQPDADHVQVTFKDATVAGVPVNGIHSYQVTAVEPGVQTGPDGSFTIDLARPVHVTAFTLPATGGYAWRLVVDLHTA